MMADHDRLIEALAVRAAPVRRTASVSARAALLIPAMLALGFMTTTVLRQAVGGWSLPAGGAGIAYAALCLLLGSVALVQALTISIPGRPLRGAGWMMAATAAWLGVAAVAINNTAATGSAPGGRPFCFAFLMVAGLPMIAVIVLALRRTGSIRPVSTLVAAGGGVAFLSFGLLAFCHPVDLSIADFATHLMAALVLGLLTVAGGRRAIAA